MFIIKQIFFVRKKSNRISIYFRATDENKHEAMSECLVTVQNVCTKYQNESVQNILINILKTHVEVTSSRKPHY